MSPVSFELEKNFILDYLKQFKKKQGLYIIKPKNTDILISICNKLDYKYSSEIAYIGLAKLNKNSDLYNRAKQEMGWANFEAATFVKKIGSYLDFDTSDKYNKIIRDQTKNFICSNFNIECIVFDNSEDLNKRETEYISLYKPCLNIKKVKQNGKIRI